MQNQGSARGTPHYPHYLSRDGGFVTTGAANGKLSQTTLGLGSWRQEDLRNRESWYCEALAHKALPHLNTELNLPLSAEPPAGGRPRPTECAGVGGGSATTATAPRPSNVGRARARCVHREQRPLSDRCFTVPSDSWPCSYIAFLACASVP